MSEKKLFMETDLELASAITHSGTFHADDIFSTILLMKVKDRVHLCRVDSAPESVDNSIIVFDIGGGKYDHHQKDFNECRESGTKYASFGLLWKDYGWDYISKRFLNVDSKLAAEIFDREFVEGIDATDNGQVVKNNDSKVQFTSISGVIGMFNPIWDSNENSDTTFYNTVMIAEKIFDRALERAVSKARAKDAVDKAISESSMQIMVLDKSMPWINYLFESNDPKAKDILYVVYPSDRGGYHVRAVPEFPGSFSLKKAFPKEWAGLRNEELAKITGIVTATFCHNNCYLCCADKLNDAMLLAHTAVILEE